MSTQDDLLFAIHEHPDDDFLRLIYSDWLEENDRIERAELIRVQVALAQTKDERARTPLVQREWALLFHPERLVTWGPLTGFYLSFNRGFVSRISVRGEHFLADFLTVAPALLLDLIQACLSLDFEWTGGVGLYDDGQPGTIPWETLAEVLRLPLCRRCTEMVLENGHFTLLVAEVLREATICNLVTQFNLEGMELAPGALAVFLESPWLTHLRRLELSSGCFTTNGPYDGYLNAPLTAEEIASLARSPYLANLEELVLYERGVTADSATLLLTSPALRRLRSLRLSLAPIGDERWSQLEARFGDRLKR